MMARSAADISTMQGYFGAIPSQDGVLFRICAPDVRSLSLELLDGAAAGTHPLASAEAGTFETWVKGAAAGDNYIYIVDGSERLPIRHRVISRTASTGRRRSSIPARISGATTGGALARRSTASFTNCTSARSLPRGRSHQLENACRICAISASRSSN